MSVRKVIEFHSAHFLPGHVTCGQMHGHTFRLEVEVSGPIRDGMVMDFSELKAILNGYLVDIDHHCLNDLLPMPTAENLLQLLVSRITLPAYVTLEEMCLWETSTNCAIWRRDA